MSDIGFTGASSYSVCCPPSFWYPKDTRSGAISGGIQIPTEETEKFKTVADLLSHLQQKGPTKG